MGEGAAPMEFMALLPYAVQYSGYVFAVGFIFGMIRNLWANAVFGEEVSIMYEVPLMLAASWLIWKYIAHHLEQVQVTICEGDSCRREKRKLTQQDVFVLGAISFLYLMTYEFMLTKLMMKETLLDFVVQQLSYPKTIGLAGQLGFGCIPMIQFFLQQRGKKSD